MQQVLVYGDSLSWGIIPGTRQRLKFEERWPGVLELELAAQAGESVRIIEDCLNGRRTVFEDPFKPGRNGLIGLEQRIEVNSPLALVILLLGTNDFQATHRYNAYQSAQGVNTLIGAIRRAPIEPGMPSPEILIVAPPSIQKSDGPLAPKFVDAESKSKGFAEQLQIVANEAGCHYYNSGTLISTSQIDGVHLDADQHRKLGTALAPIVRPLLENASALRK